MSFKDFADDIEQHQADAECIRKGLWHEGPNLIRALQDRGGFGNHSLRSVARECGVSAAYLCRVSLGQSIVSAGCFVRMARVLEKTTKKGAKA